MQKTHQHNVAEVEKRKVVQPTPPATVPAAPDRPAARSEAEDRKVVATGAGPGPNKTPDLMAREAGSVRKTDSARKTRNAPKITSALETANVGDKFSEQAGDRNG